MTRPAPRVWITRTQPGAEATARRVQEMGWTPVVAPLLEVRPISGAMLKSPTPSGLAGVALTSPNTITTIAKDLAAYNGLPFFAVGDATAEAARAAGLTNVTSAGGDIHALARLIASKLSKGTVFAPGALEPAGDLPALLPEHSVIRLPVYETLAVTPAVPEDLSAVLVHSPRAARILANLLPPEIATNLLAVTISAAAKAPLEALDFKKIAIAPTPDEEGVLRTLGNSASPV